MTKMQAGDWMKPDPMFIKPEDKLIVAATLMNQSHMDVLPVGRPGNIIGTVNRADIDQYKSADNLRALIYTLVLEIMKQGVHTCSADCDIAAAMEEMLSHKTSYLFVTNKAADITGILLMEDIQHHFFLSSKRLFL